MTPDKTSEIFNTTPVTKDTLYKVQQNGTYTINNPLPPEYMWVLVGFFLVLFIIITLTIYFNNKNNN